MNRQQSGAQQQAILGRADQSREIGLRAVAAAILYQGDAGNAERMLSREPSAPAVPTAQSGDREP
jgi:hypothetical protein